MLVTYRYLVCAILLTCLWCEHD